VRTFAFVDASNLFYGGEKSLGWKIDYEKLFVYLKEKYQVGLVFISAALKFTAFRMIIKATILSHSKP